MRRDQTRAQAWRSVDKARLVGKMAGRQAEQRGMDGQTLAKGSE